MTTWFWKQSGFSVKQHFFRSRVLKAGKGAEARERDVFLETLEWKGENTRWNIPMYINIYIYMYTCRLYIYIYRYTYYIILDQHKSNNNTKGLRREIAFKLLAVRNHTILQFSHGGVFLNIYCRWNPQNFRLFICLLMWNIIVCPVWFSLSRVVMSWYWNCRSWSPCRFEGSIFLLGLDPPERKLDQPVPQALLFKSNKVVCSIQVRMN